MVYTSGYASQFTGGMTLQGRPQMNRYDIVFIGQLGTGTIVPFEGPPFVELGSPVLFASIAASCLEKRIAAVTRVSESEEYVLEPLKTAGIDLFVKPGEMYRIPCGFPDRKCRSKAGLSYEGRKTFCC